MKKWPQDDFDDVNFMFLLTFSGARRSDTKRYFCAFFRDLEKGPKSSILTILQEPPINDETINDRTCNKITELPRQLSWEISSRVSEGCKRTLNDRAGHVSGRVQV